MKKRWILTGVAILLALGGVASLIVWIMTKGAFSRTTQINGSDGPIVMLVTQTVDAWVFYLIAGVLLLLSILCLWLARKKR